VSAVIEAEFCREGATASRPVSTLGEVQSHGLTPENRERVEAMQRARLLASMTAVTSERGFAEATVARVVKRAGVSRRTFYDLFEDREACLSAAFAQATERLAARVGAEFHRPGRWRERARAALAALLAGFDADVAVARLCVVEATKGGPELLQRRREVLDALAAAVEEAREEARGSSSPPPLTAESTVGGALAVIHARLLADPGPEPSLHALLNPLMSMIVHPYLGPAAARRELEQPLPDGVAGVAVGDRDAPAEPFADLSIRITFRTARVLSTVGALPGASNRDIARAAGVSDQGQMSKLLRRLERAGLIDNHGEGQARGEPNAWRLTRRGEGILRTVGIPTGA
jgi:AcrR family transcriptional regulator